MTVFNSKINVNSESYAKNRREMLAHIEQLQILNARGALISEQRKPRFEARGQRERALGWARRWAESAPASPEPLAECVRLYAALGSDA